MWAKVPDISRKGVPNRMAAGSHPPEAGTNRFPKAYVAKSYNDSVEKWIRRAKISLPKPIPSMYTISQVAG